MPPEFKIPKRRRKESVVDRKEGAIQSSRATILSLVEATPGAPRR